MIKIGDACFHPQCFCSEFAAPKATRPRSLINCSFLLCDGPTHIIFPSKQHPRRARQEPKRPPFPLFSSTINNWLTTAHTSSARILVNYIIGAVETHLGTNLGKYVSYETPIARYLYKPDTYTNYTKCARNYKNRAPKTCKFVVFTMQRPTRDLATRDFAKSRVSLKRVAKGCHHCVISVQSITAKTSFDIFFTPPVNTASRHSSFAAHTKPAIKTGKNRRKLVSTQAQLSFGVYSARQTQNQLETPAPTPDRKRSTCIISSQVFGRV